MALPQDDLGGAKLLGVQPAARLPRVVDDAVVQREAEIAHRRVAAEVLVGLEQDLGPRSNAHGMARSAFDEVHIAPPWRPVKALIAAVEFM